MYATEVAFTDATKNQDVAARARTYGMDGILVDGNDVIEVYGAAETAVARARAGKGPTLIECRTYRTRPHAEGMRDVGYRTDEEIETWKKRDPIQMLKQRMLDIGIVSETDLETVEKSVETQVQDAVEFANKSPYPDPATVSHHIFSAI
jgi:2-oxoisovalerate dehydrogenase E1 component